MGIKITDDSVSSDLSPHSAGLWFTHGADSYVRTREQVPLSRMEKAIPVDKTWVSRIPQRQREIGE